MGENLHDSAGIGIAGASPIAFGSSPRALLGVARASGAVSLFKTVFAFLWANWVFDFVLPVEARLREKNSKGASVGVDSRSPATSGRPRAA